MAYEELPQNMRFDTRFDKYILAYCPDSVTWFATNERSFFYEYPLEFNSEQDAIEFFEKNPDLFLKIENEMVNIRPSIFDGGVLLENTKKLVKVA